MFVGNSEETLVYNSAALGEVRLLENLLELDYEQFIGAFSDDK